MKHHRRKHKPPPGYIMYLAHDELLLPQILPLYKWMPFTYGYVKIKGSKEAIALRELTYIAHLAAYKTKRNIKLRVLWKS